MADIAAVHAEVSRILDADLRALTDRQRLSVVPPVARGDWDLPEPDATTLWTYGLPPARDDDLFGVVGSYQSEPAPALDLDGWTDGGPGGYLLGTFGEARIAARAGSGAVLAVPSFTVDDVHPQLRHQFPDGVHPVVMNSSVSRLVDFAWRWHWLLPILAAQQVKAGQDEHAAWQHARTEADQAALPDFFAPVRSICDRIIERFRALDPTAVPEDGTLVWPEAVLESL